MIMKLKNIFGVVLILHVLFLSILFVQPGCATTAKKTEPVPDDTLVSEVESQEAETSLDAGMHPAFNAGIEPERDVSSSRPGRYSPTRPSWSFEQDTSLEAGELLEPLGGESLSFEDIYIVQKGDSLWSISRGYGVSLLLLLKINGFSSDTVIYAGQEILIPAAASSVAASGPDLSEFSGTTYTVVSGDTLTIIARMHDTTVAALMSANALANDTIYKGQVLIIPSGAEAWLSDFPDTGLAPQEQVSTSGDFHVVQSGDTPIRIAQKYGVNVMVLMADNNIVDPTMLQVGQVLIIPGRDDIEFPPLEVERQEWPETDETVPGESEQSLSLEDLESILFEEREIPMVPVDEEQLKGGI